MPVALVNGVRLNYVQIDEPGDGKPREDLLMVHGLATNMAFWYLPYAPVFARRFRVTLFDLRGLGRSEQTPDGYTPQNLARDMAGLMDHLEIARAHVVAHSFGGVVALNLACQDASRVRSLVLADSHISAVRHRGVRREWSNRPHVQEILDRCGLKLDTHDPYFGYRLLTEVAHLQIRNAEVPAELMTLVGPIMGRHGKRTAQQWVRLMDETRAEAELMGDDGLALEDLRRLLFPILALYGDHSQALLTGGELLDVWPHAEFRRVRDAGHFFPASRPQDVMRECERFWHGDYHRGAVVRAGEELRRHFRSDRLFQGEGGWFFTTRETRKVGPFDTVESAYEALARYISGITVPA
ncbi:alpha/beta hydrolase [Rubrivivax gelatinosus]|nr:alpha/beta hydrolase [Rubrivivax gelatinosus]